MRRGGSGSGCLSLPAQASAPLWRKSATELQYSVTGTIKIFTSKDFPNVVFPKNNFPIFPKFILWSGPG